MQSSKSIVSSAGNSVYSAFADPDNDDPLYNQVMHFLGFEDENLLGGKDDGSLASMEDDIYLTNNVQTAETDVAPRPLYMQVMNILGYRAASNIEDSAQNQDLRSPLLEAEEKGAIIPEEEILYERKTYSTLRICAMLASGFSWGCVSTTMLLLTLPLECQRLGADDKGDSSSSIYLALFIFLAGLTQLVCPLVGKLSDESVSIPNQWGRRVPFILLGSFMGVISLISMIISSWFKFWVLYAIAYTFFMIAMNVIYSSMIALIPDLIAPDQVGQANGLLAFEMVLGSLFGFGCIQGFLALNEAKFPDIGELKLCTSEMYVLYILVLSITSLITVASTEERTDVNVTSSATEEQNESKTCCSSLLTIWSKAIKKAFSQSSKDICAAYSISPNRHGDFFFVTVSRTFYYMGISVQAFFLYYIHDILRDHSAVARSSPETIVSTLALITQFSGVFTPYPAGLISDKCLNGRRKPLIYLFCVLLAACTFSLIFFSYVKQLFIVCVVVGLANGGYLTMETSLAVDSLEKMNEEHKEKLNSEVQLVSGDNADSDEMEGAAQLLGIWGVAAFFGKNVGRRIFDLCCPKTYVCFP